MEEARKARRYSAGRISATEYDHETPEGEKVNITTWQKPGNHKGQKAGGDLWD